MQLINSRAKEKESTLHPVSRLRFLVPAGQEIFVQVNPKAGKTEWLLQADVCNQRHREAEEYVSGHKVEKPGKKMSDDDRAVFNARTSYLMSPWNHRTFLMVSKPITRKFDLDVFLFANQLLTGVCTDIDDMLKPISQQAVNKMIKDRWSDLYIKNHDSHAVQGTKLKFGTAVDIVVPGDLNSREALLETARAVLTAYRFRPGDGTFFVSTYHDDADNQIVRITMIPAVYYGRKKNTVVRVMKKGVYQSGKTGCYCKANDPDAVCVVQPGTKYYQNVYFSMSTHFLDSSDSHGEDYMPRDLFTHESRVGRKMLADLYEALGCRRQMVLLGRYDRNNLFTAAARRNVKLYNGFFQRMEKHILIPLIEKVKGLEDEAALIGLKRLMLRLRDMQFKGIQTKADGMERSDRLVRLTGAPVWKVKDDMLDMELRMKRAIIAYETQYAIA